MFAPPQQVFEAAARAHQAGRVPEATALYRQVLSADPRHAGALSNLGLLLAEHGDAAEAERMLVEATRVAPQYTGGFVNLALLLHERARHDEAIAAAQAGLALSPGHRTLENLLVSSLGAAGRYDEAIARLTRMVAAHPGYANGHMLLGTAYTKTGRPDEAVASFERAAKAQKGDTTPLVSAAECLMLHGRTEEALKYLDRVLKMRGWDARAIALKTLALADLGRVDDERALADPATFVHVLRLSDFGYTADDAASLNRRLSAFASHEPSMKEDPAEYATAKGWHSTTNLAQSGDPAIEELKRFIDWGFHERRRRLAEIDADHPFAKYAPTKYYMDMWAVRMQDSGKMLPHIHLDGWLSGAYYVDVPSVINDPTANEAGWIKFGPPRADIKLRRSPLLRTVRPEPGLMATFPSYIWHDTIPLPADNREQRLVLAYDLNPVR